MKKMFQQCIHLVVCLSGDNIRANDPKTYNHLYSFLSERKKTSLAF